MPDIAQGKLQDSLPRRDDGFVHLAVRAWAIKAVA
jgi:hypothetical protein